MTLANGGGMLKKLGKIFKFVIRMSRNLSLCISNELIHLFKGAPRSPAEIRFDILRRFYLGEGEVIYR